MKGGGEGWMRGDAAAGYTLTRLSPFSIDKKDLKPTLDVLSFYRIFITVWGNGGKKDFLICFRLRFITPTMTFSLHHHHNGRYSTEYCLLLLLLFLFLLQLLPLLLLLQTSTISISASLCHYHQIY